jgi:hypothetical protein
LTSRLGALPVEVTDRVLAGSHDITVPAGGLVFRDGDAPVFSWSSTACCASTWRRRRAGS